MTTRATERRKRRVTAQQVFDNLALDYEGVADVSPGRMFGSTGLTVNGKFFAFIGRNGQLVLKLPASKAAVLLAEGEAMAVRAGRSTMREWVGIPMPADADGARRCRDLIAEACRYVLAHTPSSSKPEQ